MLDIEFRNLLTNRKITDKERIELSTLLSSIKKDIKPDLDACVICGKKVTSFCKSHSIPSYILKGIANNGEITIGRDFVSPNKEKNGIRNTLLFSCICNDCDNTYFQEYENDSLVNNKVTDIIINEIAIKNYLRHYYKRLEEQKLYELLIKKNNESMYPDPYFDQMFSNRLLTTRLDINDALNRINKSIKRKIEKLFYLIDEIDLDYQTEIAYQGGIALSEGFDGRVNELDNYDPRYKIEQLYLCVFPHNQKTKILVFCEDGATRLRCFYKKYKKLDLDSKLYVLNYLLLLYDEEWCVSGDFDKQRLNEETMKLIGLTTDISVEGNNINEYFEQGASIISEKKKELFKIQTSGDIYNFLTKHN